MNRRILVDAIAEDAALAKLGMLANLVFDRLLTLTDDAGLCPGEPEILKGRCFPLMPDVGTDQIRQAVQALVEAALLRRLDYRGRVVLGFKPEAFREHQKLRRDYKRRFHYGELSERVWEQGFPEPSREPDESRTDPDLFAPAAPPPSGRTPNDPSPAHGPIAAAVPPVPDRPQTDPRTAPEREPNGDRTEPGRSPNGFPAISSVSVSVSASVPEKDMSAPAPPDPTPAPPDIRSPAGTRDVICQVFRGYLEAVGKSEGRYRLTPERRRWIRERLADFTPEQLVQAARHFAQDPWEERRCFNGMEYLYRKHDQTEKWLNAPESDRARRPAHGRRFTPNDALSPDEAQAKYRGTERVVRTDG